jgi:SAM-dependent methyltransferase
MTYDVSNHSYHMLNSVQADSRFRGLQNRAVLNPNVWKKEYGSSKILPSSYREEPSHALKRAEQIIGPFSGFDVVDVGCGNGRNALALALQNRVHAIDFCADALAILKRKVALSQSPVEVSTHLWNLLIPNNAFIDRFDIMLDAYFSCHIVNETILNIWHSNAHGYLRPGGLLVMFGFTEGDGYYAQFETTKSGALLVSKDSITGIDKRLDSYESVQDLFPKFSLVHLENIRFHDFVLDSEYDREILLSILRTTPKLI